MKTSKQLKFIEIHKKGLTTKQMARQLHRSIGSITSMRLRLNLKLNREIRSNWLTTTEVKKILDLQSKDFSQKQIAIKLHRSPATVKNCLDRYRLTPVKGKSGYTNIAIRKQIKRLYAKKLDDYDMAAKLKTSCERIQYFRRAIGLKRLPSLRERNASKCLLQIKRLCKLPLSTEEIANTLGIAKSAVAHILHRERIMACMVCRLSGDKKKKCLRCNKTQPIRWMHGKGNISHHAFCCGKPTTRECRQLVPGWWDRQKQYINNYRKTHKELNNRITRQCNLKTRIAIIQGYGGECQKERANLDSTCVGSLEIAHWNHDGGEHRAALGNKGNCGSASVNRFIARVLKNGSEKDKTGKVWTKEMFGILCHSHHRKFDLPTSQQQGKDRWQDPAFRNKVLIAKGIKKE